MERKIIGVCLSRIYLDNQTNMIKALCKYAELNRMKLFVFNTLTYVNENPFNAERKMFDAINFDVLDGLIIFPDYIRDADITRSLVAKSKEMGIPVIVVDGYEEGCYNINFDYITSFEHVVRHMIVDHQCKYVNFIAAQKGNPYSEARLDCYKRVLAENNLPFEEERVYYGDFEYAYTYTLMEQMMEKGSLPQALICANDTMAMAACDFLYERGIKSPKDILITGFDGSQEEMHHTPRITTSYQDWEEIGDKVVGVFASLFSGREAQNDIIISYKPRISQSCGCEPLVITESNYQTFENAQFWKDKTLFSEKLAISSHKMSAAKSYDEFFDKMEAEMELIKCRSYRLCLLDGFMTKDFTEEVLFSVVQHSWDSATMMNMPFSWKNGVQRKQSDMFPRSELMPQITDIAYADDESHIFFFPVCYNEKYIGFAAIEFDVASVDFGNIFNYIITFSSDIGFFKSNYDMLMAITTLKYMYIHDTMTNLLNRRGFYAEIEKALSNPNNAEKYLIIFAIDIDGMKYINDNYGHHEGDIAIKVVANSMMYAGKEIQAINVRFGGDELMTAAITEKPEQIVQTFTQDLLNLIEHHNQHSGKEYDVRSSIGYAYGQVAVIGNDVDNLIRLADISMYDNKKNKTSYRRSLSEKII